jgi:DNA-binding Xre family transcriptional regulator
MASRQEFLGELVDSNGEYEGQVLLREVNGRYHCRFLPVKGRQVAFPSLSDYNALVRHVRGWVRQRGLKWAYEIPTRLDSRSLKRAFEGSALTQIELAKRVGLSQASISGLLRGAVSPRKNRRAVIEKICDALGVMPRDITVLPDR